MCEPAHSIVQYPHDFSDDGLPFGGTMDKESRLKAALGKACGWTKKIGKWFHLSRFGAGHSNATEMSGRSSLYLPNPELYEGLWWKREFQYDGWDRAAVTEEAMQAAEQYHKASATGNIKLFRRFLETSMKRSNGWAHSYVERMLDFVFTAEGGNKLLEKIRRVFGRDAQLSRIFSTPEDSYNRDKGIGVLMGFTRRRNLFLPHFADDDSLWVPGGKARG